MASVLRFSFSLSSLNILLHDHSNTKTSCFRKEFSQPSYSHSTSKIGSALQNGFGKRVYGEKFSFLGVKGGQIGILKKRAVLVRFNRLNGDDRGGWKVDVRILGNLGLAVALTYLSMTGQLGWVLDAIVSVGLLAVILPMVGIGAFIWWAGRDIVQGTCPNCKSEFQTFKSMLGDDMQLCPYCGQPFSVVGDQFVQDPVNFSNQSTTFDQAFGDFSPRSKKGNDSSIAVVDVEAEVKDAD